MKIKDDIRKGLYEILDWLERERSKRVREFWICDFKETILNQYPTLRLLRNSLMDASPLKKGGEKSIWTWPIRNLKLPVKCGKQKGILNRDRLAKGEECIVVGKRWFTPNEFERFSGKESSRNWKLSIRCRGTTLKKLIEEGHLKAAKYKGGCKKAKKSLLPSCHATTGSFQFDKQPPESVETEESDEGKRKELSEGEEGKEKQESSVKKKRKLRSSGTSDDEEESPRKKFKKTCFSSPLKKGGEKSIWSWTNRNLKLPVTCGDQEGILNRDRLAKGEECIVVGKRWFTPNEFERFSGKESSKNWKLSIRYRDTTLKKLIEEGHLKTAKYKGGCKKAKKSLLPSGHATTGSDEAEDEEEDCDLDEEDRLSSSSKYIPLGFAASPLKKGGEKSIWSWTIRNLKLPVKCGKQKGILNRDRLAKGKKCIMFKKQWFTPNEFERFSGKESSRNWKLSIRCRGTPLGKLVEEGHLKAARYKGGCKKAKKSLLPSGHATTGSDEAEDEEEDRDLDEEDQFSSSSKESSTAVAEEGQTEQQTEVSHDSGRKVFRVTCGAAAGTLHKKRFASGTLGKSIRTETSWMTPMEFLKVAPCQKDASWKKDIKCEGEPLSVLIEAEILRIHSLLCNCRLCKPDCKDLENLKNDDECCVCKSEDEDELVVCDHCPRSFHQKCHLPHVEDVMLGDDRPWMCTFCIFRINQEYFYREELEREAAMLLQISQRMLQCQYLLLCLCSADEEQIFAANPQLYLNDYSAVIKTPMWLGHIADKLQTQLYQNVGEFVIDILLIFSNCALYNRDNAEFLATGNRLKELFDREFKSVFNIKE